MKYDYYYNITPQHGKVRNNLIYTSLISEDKRVFVQWYHNDTEYHMGKNQVVDPALMEDKWQRELKYLKFMAAAHPDMVPKILDIDEKYKKIYLAIDGVDLWQQSLDNNASFDGVLPGWRNQALAIIKAHKDLNLYKFSWHPSSFFVVGGELKTINYFFVYHKDEGPISIKDHQSHISLDRQTEMRKIVERNGISWDNPEPLDVLQKMAFDSFRFNYPIDFIESAKRIYSD
jgi:hypothetical protein